MNILAKPELVKFIQTKKDYFKFRCFSEDKDYQTDLHHDHFLRKAEKSEINKLIVELKKKLKFYQNRPKT